MDGIISNVGQVQNSKQMSYMMDIKNVGDRECIQCGECIDVCPEKAITFKAGKLVLRGPDIAHKEAES